MEVDECSANNKFLVGVSGARIVILKPRVGSMSKDDAINLAAWLVALADDKDEFPAMLEAIKSA